MDRDGSRWNEIHEDFWVRRPCVFVLGGKGVDRVDYDKYESWLCVMSDE